MIKNKMNIYILLIYVAGMILITIVQVIAIVMYPDILNNDDTYITFSSLTNLGLYLSLSVVLVYFFKDYFKEQLRHLKEHRFLIMKIISLGIFIMLGASILGNVILELLGVTETSENQESLNMLLEGTLFDKVSLFIFVVFFAPLVEELVFRKAILDMFHFDLVVEDGTKKARLQKFGLAAVAVLISSLAFGFIHVTSGDYIQIVYYALLGGVLGIIYLLAKKNIFAPIFVHLLLNLFVTTLMFFG